MIRSVALSVALAACAALAGCDNIASVYGGHGPGGAASNISVVPVGGVVVDRKPAVTEAYPAGAGVPTTVPIVVVFSESMNPDTIAPDASTPGATGGVLLRDAEMQQPLPASYDFLFGDRVVVIRPLAALPEQLAFEVVVDPSVRDVDGVAVGGAEPSVVAEFFTDQDPAVEDGRVVATLPLDDASDQQRETPVYVVFDKQPDTMSASMAFQLRDAQGAVVPGQVSFPLVSSGQPDGRVLRFDPDASALAGAEQHEIVFSGTVTFGTSGTLSAGGTVLADFTTLPFTAVQAVGVGNAAAGFAGQVSRANLENLVVDVTVDATAAAGDTVAVRVYGLEATTSEPNDLALVERSAQLTGGGAQTVSVDFAAALGTLLEPRFGDGRLTLAAEIRRGSTRTAGFITDTGSSQDTVPPDLLGVGPPASAGGFDLYFDQESVVFHGRANEPVGDATLTIGGTMAALFASADDGRFVMTPIDFALGASAAGYTLSITDRAGNTANAAFTGNVVPRGAVIGSAAASGSVVVDAYDEATMLGIAGATVVVEQGLPQKPPSGQAVLTTNAGGRAVFPASVARHSVTVVAAGYHLTSLLDTGAGFVSLPLRPLVGATATLQGAAGFMASVGDTALVGSNLIDDPLAEEITTEASAPIVLPDTLVRPNRLQVFNAFAGRFEPNSLPAFSFHACQMCGADGLTPSMASGPFAPDGSSTETLTLLPVVLSTLNLAAPYSLDFSGAAGLDLGNLVQPPTVRVLGSLTGFGGQTLFGVGYAADAGGGVYDVNATYSLTTATNLAPYGPVLFVSTEAEDVGGNLSRQRRLVDISTGITLPTLAPLGIPTVSLPASSNGAPEVTVQDRVDVGGIGLVYGARRLVVTDADGREWHLWQQDSDGALGPVAVQLPDLSGTGAAALAPGTWSVFAESHVFFSLSMQVDRLLLEEIRRGQLAFARGIAATVTVN